MRTHALLVLLMLTAGPGHGTELYRADFDHPRGRPGAPANFTAQEGLFTSSGGWLEIRSKQQNPWVLLQVKHDGDGTFRGTVRNADGCHWSALRGWGVYRLEINRQYVQLHLLRLSGGEWKVAAVNGEYGLCARNTQQYELRLVVQGRRVRGFLDDKKLLDWQDPEPAPSGGEFSLLGGWGSDVAWRDVTLSDQPDLREWPYEAPAKAAPADLAQVTWVRNSSPDGIYADGQPVGLKVRLRCPRGQPTRLRLRFRLVDVCQQEVARKVAEVSFGPGEEKELAVEFQPPPRGCFKVALDAGLSSAEPAWVEDLGSFTVVARRLSQQAANPASPFGGHMDGINFEWHFRAARKLGVQWARCHDMLQQGWWTRIQPDGPGQWLWPYDEAQRKLEELGFSTLGEFLWSPGWATSAGPASPGNPAAYPPRDWAAFARYVAATVRHYGGSIRTWEVWNEPHYDGFFRGTPADYARLLEAAWSEVKRTDPACLVVGGGGVNLRSMAWIQAMLDAGAGPHMDAFSLHYLEPDLADDAVPRLRRLLDAHHMSGPLWNTEETVPSSSFLDQCRGGRMEPEARYHFRNACYELVRVYMGNLASGVQRVFYYDLADPWRFQQFPKARVFQPAPVGGTMWDEGQMLKPLAAAHAALAVALEGKTFGSRHSRGALDAFIFEGPDSATAVQYATFPSFARQERLRLTLPPEISAEAFRVINFMGNEWGVSDDGGALVVPLSRQPVYLVYEGRRPGDVLRQMYGGAELKAAPRAASNVQP